MILEPGNKLLIAHRRLFEQDHARFFLGVVDAYEDGLVRVTGRSWNRDPYSGVLSKKQDERTKIVALASGTVIAYFLPQEVRLDAVEIQTDDHQRVFLTDGKHFSLDITERKLRV